jgi:hypothetical protein
MNTKTKTPNGNGSNTSGTATDGPREFRNNPEVDAKIDAFIKENAKDWAYIQAMPRERLERSLVLEEVKKRDRQQRIKNGIMKEIDRNPELKQAYDTLLKSVPENLRESVMTQVAGQARRAINRSQRQVGQRV